MNIFRHPVELYYQNKQLQGHWTGIIASVLFCFFFVVISLFFGVDFYTRTNPFINKVDLSIQDFQQLIQKIPYYPPLVMALQKTVAFRYLPYFFQGKQKRVFQPCSEAELAFTKFQFNPNFEMYCLDISKLEIDFSLDSSLYLIDCSMAEILGFKQEDLLKGYCQDYTENDIYRIENFYTHFYLPKLKLEMNNYEQPIETYYEVFSTSNQLHKLNAMTLKIDYVEVLDDKGWIFKDEFSYYGVRMTMIYNTSLPFEYDSFYSRYNLQINRLLEQHKRIYKKIQALAAEIGGFLKICMVVIRFPMIFLVIQSVKVNCIKDFLTNTVAKSYTKINLNASENNQDKSNMDLSKFKTDRQADRQNPAYNSQSVRNRNSTISKEEVKVRLMNKMVWKNVCCKKNTDDIHEHIFETAENLTKHIMSVEFLFRSYFELDVIKRILFDEDEINMIRMIKNPDIFRSQDLLTKRLLDSERPLTSAETVRIKTSLEERLKDTTTEHKKFDEVIANYL